MSTRIAKTFQNLRSGKLFGLTSDMKYMVTEGRGHMCVREMRSGDFSLHLACAEAWLRSSQQQHGLT